MLLILTLLCGCGQKSGGADIPGNLSDTPDSQEDAARPEALSARPCLIRSNDSEEIPKITPSVTPYEIAPDLGNIENLWQYYFNEGMKEKLVQNGFFVRENAGNEFFEIYESNRYSCLPNFVTVDSLMHTYHLYFAYLLKNIEKDCLTEDLTQLSHRMLEDSLAQYDVLAGSEWEDAARRNVAFFGVGTRLLGGTVDVDDSTAEIINYEIDRIKSAQGVSVSRITGGYEDYSQYIPRGYYTDDWRLAQYFRAMMWYGRIHFSQTEEDLNRSALLMTKALKNDAEAYPLWESIYAVTSFFAGASDDQGVCEYEPAIFKVYGADAEIGDLIGDEASFAEFCELIANLPSPQINSIPIEDGEDNTIKGFRFMGQRFTIDGAIMQRLIYSSVKSNARGEKRMLPDVLDVPAALGSDTALDLLQADGAAEYEGYSEHMADLRDILSQDDSSLWTASLYAGWLNTLRPLLEENGEGYPMFMQSGEWRKKNLECFAGSFTELKHDTILYAKQVIAEMGGGWDEEIDDRGYVEPEPLVYARFANLAKATSDGLKRYGMLSETGAEDLERLSFIAGQLLTISGKELTEQPLSDEEYDFIRDYGGNIEHFWYEAARAESGRDDVYSQEFPASLVVDIATDPDSGTVLEAATGNPSVIYVVVPVDGKLRIASGSVFSFYQFTWPSSDRLTDSAWRQIMGVQYDEDGNCLGRQVCQPDWTAGYRYE